MLPGDKNRLIPTLVVDVHRASHPNVKNGRTKAYKATNPLLPTVCYAVVMPKLPSIDAPDLLSATKKFPKTVVDDNPEDPIFWSTCYERVAVRDWLPLIGAPAPKQEAEAPQYASRAVQFHPHGGQSDFVWLPARTPHGVHRTCGEPDEIKKIPTRNILPLFFVL